jgi:plasmid replication initiation protein
MKNAGRNDLPRTLTFHPHNLLKAIKRTASGTDYERLRAGLDRLKTTVITTNIRAKGRKRYRKFGWIDQWTEEIEEDTGRTKHMTLTLSDWMYEGVIQDGGVLAIHPDYFLLTGGLERCLYRIARKHAGRQNVPWFVSLTTLYAKTGSNGTLKEFTRMIRKIAAADNLPEYHLFLTTKNEAGALTAAFSRRKSGHALPQPPKSRSQTTGWEARVNPPRRRLV